MNFETIRDNIISILGSREDGNFRTIGYQERVSSADEVVNNNRAVEVFYSSGQFPQSGSTVLDFKDHHAEFRVVLSASSATKIDLSVIDDPGSDPGQIAALPLVHDGSGEKTERERTRVDTHPQARPQ